MKKPREGVEFRRDEPADVKERARKRRRLQVVISLDYHSTEIMPREMERAWREALLSEKLRGKDFDKATVSVFPLISLQGAKEAM